MEEMWVWGIIKEEMWVLERILYLEIDDKRVEEEVEDIY